MKNYLSMIRRQQRPVKFLMAQMLKRTRLCKFFSISQQGYTLKFYPSNLSTTLWIDPHDRDEDQAFLRSYIKPGDVVVDVGANIGFTVLASALATGPSGKVIAFEPHPRICSYLRGNVARNKVNNVQIHNVALGEKSGVVSFSDTKRDDMNKPVVDGSTGQTDFCAPVLFPSPGTPGEGQGRGFRATSDADPPPQPSPGNTGGGGKKERAITLDCSEVQTPLKTLDESLAGEPRIDLLKVDVEGYEKFVFQGGANVLSKTACVYFESSEENFKAFNYSTRDLLTILASAGFRILRINDQRSLVDVPQDYSPAVVENLIAIRSVEDFTGRTGLRPTGV
jgi:hypothetical protein